MSHSLIFYRVSKVTEDLPDTINADCTELQYYVTNADGAADWETEIGITRTIEFSMVDQFGAGEKIFGKKPLSISSSPYYYLAPEDPCAELVFHFSDGESKRVPRSELEKYRVDMQHLACIYCRDEIARIEYGYTVESETYEGRPLSEKEILQMARQYLNDHGNDGYGYLYEPDPMVEIMRAYFAVVDGDCIICISM